MGLREAKLYLVVKKHQVKSWYALYTKPRWEKKVFGLLQSKGWETYCPLNKVTKRWSDRYKIIEEPLFRSYVFVRASKADFPAIRLINGVVNFVYWLGKPALIKDEDIVRIKAFLNEYSNVKVYQSADLKPGDHVVITSGLLMEHEGKVISTDKKRVEIKVESLGSFLVAYVEKEKVTLKS